MRHVEKLAERKGCTPAQLALAWVLAQGEDIVPIPGSRSRAHLEQNIGALTIQLDGQDLAAIAAVFPGGAAAGSRYPEAMMQLLGK